MNRIALAAGALALVAVPVATVSLRGSPAIMRLQNWMADKTGLSRLKGPTQLAQFKKAGRLVPLPSGKTVRVDHRLKHAYRYARPWTVRYARRFGGDYYHRFHKSIQINSAVRTVAYQHQLMKHNPNAARGTNHWTQSSHLTGATIDITKKGMSRAGLKWSRVRLKQDMWACRIIATEERLQPVFHVMVLKPHARCPWSSRSRHARREDSFYL